MAAADRATISSGTSVETLMERAGAAVARVAIELAGGRYGRRFAIVCGPGNNGGDGFVAARRLIDAGASVSCGLLGDRSKVKGAALYHLELLERRGGRVRAFAPRLLDGADVIVDALFGTGFKGAAEGDSATAIHAVNATGRPVVAVDIPSGIDGRNGEARGPAVRATTTVCMAAEKIGTAVGAGAVLAGRVEVVDIGITLPATSMFEVEGSDVAAWLPRRAPDSHKRSHGWVALLTGSDDVRGAPILAAHGAARMGAGYVTLGSTASVVDACSLTLPEVLTERVTEKAVLDADAVDAFKEVIERADALAVGPGLGTQPEQGDLVAALLARVEVPMVVDADALTLLAQAEHSIARDRSAPMVLTPHAGELGRLLQISAQDVQEDRVSSARQAASEYGCVVVLKGHRSVVADPQGRAAINPTGGPELATAGTGDVLTGALAALLAEKMDPFAAACSAVYVHGLAGAHAGERIGPDGVMASDVAEALGIARATVVTRVDQR
jgi:NAD(P)H-hydrate epimerase